MAQSDDLAKAFGVDQFPLILTTGMAAELLQVHPEHLRRLSREGKVPCHRFPGGRELRFMRDELVEWLRSQPGEDQSTSTERARQRRAPSETRA